MSENAEALNYHNQALPLRRAVGDTDGEGTSLNNLGVVYSALGEQEKAIDYLDRALVIGRAGKDRRGVAATLNNIAGL